VSPDLIRLFALLVQPSHKNTGRCGYLGKVGFSFEREAELARVQRQWDGQVRANNRSVSMRWSAGNKAAGHRAICRRACSLRTPTSLFAHYVRLSGSCQSLKPERRPESKLIPGMKCQYRQAPTIRVLLRSARGRGMASSQTGAI
jgi:hypothetical protein